MLPPGSCDSVITSQLFGRPGMRISTRCSLYGGEEKEEEKEEEEGGFQDATEKTVSTLATPSSK